MRWDVFQLIILFNNKNNKNHSSSYLYSVLVSCCPAVLHVSLIHPSCFSTEEKWHLVDLKKSRKCQRFKSPGRGYTALRWEKMPWQTLEGSVDGFSYVGNVRTVN